MPQFIRPLIVLEGFDPSKFEAIENDNWSFNDFVNAAFNGATNIDTDLNLPGMQSLNDLLDAAGYDLIFVDFNEGTGDIVRNALLVENIIRWVNSHKIANPNTDERERNVVLGQSAGGLVARYAVCDLEKRWSSDPATNHDHEVRLLVTQDAPHRGTNIPLGFQAMVNDLAPYRLTSIGLQTYGVIGAIIGSLIELRDFVPELDQADQLLDEDASEQMLVVQDGKTNIFLDGAYRNMVTFAPGYTPGFTMRALANGSECGISQLQLQPGGELLYFDANLYVNRLAYIVATTLIGPFRGIISPGLGRIPLAAFYALVPFTGKNWKTKFIARAAPSSGTNQAFFGSISFEKRIFFIPINVNLFNSTRNSVAGGLPWDSAPGGYYSLQDMQAIVPDTQFNLYPIIDINLTFRMARVFNFVPTVSALDITTNPVTQQALTSAYTGGSNPTFPSRFANFITQEQNAGEVIGSINNSRHVQFTARNANWLLDIMNGTNPVVMCSYLCSGTATSPFITGPNEICSENAAYTLNNPSGAANFTWDRSTNLNYISGQGTTMYTVSRNTNGDGFVQVILGGGCGNSDPFRMNITVGGIGYISSDYPVTGPSSVCTNQYAYYSTNDLPLATNYSWFWPSGWDYSAGQGTRFLDLFVTNASSSGTIGVRVATACDEGGSPGTLFTSVSSCGSFMMTAYPNPAQDELIIEPSSQGSTSESSQTANHRNGPLSFSAKLYDAYGELRKTANSKDGKVIMKIKDLPDGQYHLHIKTDVETVTSQIIIKR